MPTARPAITGVIVTLTNIVDPFLFFQSVCLSDDIYPFIQMELLSLWSLLLLKRACSGTLFTAILPFNYTGVNISYRVGLTLFALAIIIFFGQGYVLGFANMIASPLLPPESGFYQIMLKSYNVVYSFCVVLIVAGVVLFYKGKKESNLTPSSSTGAEK